jgi:hypothetical protein
MTAVRFPVGAKISLFVIASKPALGPASNRQGGALSLGVKWLGREADQSPVLMPISIMRGAVSLLPYTSLWRGTKLSTGYLFLVCGLIEHRDNFTFLLKLHSKLTKAGDFCFRVEQSTEEFYVTDSKFSVLNEMRCCQHRVKSCTLAIKYI